MTLNLAAWNRVRVKFLITVASCAALSTSVNTGSIKVYPCIYQKRCKLGSIVNRPDDAKRWSTRYEFSVLCKGGGNRGISALRVQLLEAVSDASLYTNWATSSKAVDWKARSHQWIGNGIDSVVENDVFSVGCSGFGLDRTYSTCALRLAENRRGRTARLRLQCQLVKISGNIGCLGCNNRVGGKIRKGHSRSSKNTLNFTLNVLRWGRDRCHVCQDAVDDSRDGGVLLLHLRSRGIQL